MKLAVWSYQAPAHIGVSKAASSLCGVHTVLRAPKGDGYGTIMLAMFERLGVTPPLTVSAMTEGTLAGAPADIGRVIAEVDRRVAPEMIVVTRSATASVLQEPLDGEIAMIPAGSVRAEIFQAGAHPVRDTEYSAFATTLRELVDHFAEDGRERTREPSVNLIGPSLLGFHDHSNVESLRRMLADLGVTCNAVVPLGASPDDLRGLGAAWLNVPTAYELALPTMERLRERFGTPFLGEPPYGESGTTRVLRELAQVLELPRSALAHAARNAKLAWYARTVDAHALSGKRVAVFAAPSAAAGIARVLADELGMQIEFIGTYVAPFGEWLRARTNDLCSDIFVTEDYREVAARIDATRPDIVFGTQMERHSSSRFGVPCAVISPPAHILNFPLGYAPFLGYDGANHIGDLVNQTQILGLEHHLIEMFGPRGQGRFAEAAPEGGDFERATENAVAGFAANGTAANAPTHGAEFTGNGGVAPSNGGTDESTGTANVHGAMASAPLENAGTAAANSSAAASREPQWDPDALRLLARIPFFVRKKARTNIERYAREQNIACVDEAVVLAAKEHVGG